MNRYTNFILTVIAVELLGILFKADFNKPANAALNPSYVKYQFEGVFENFEKIIDMLEGHI